MSIRLCREQAQGELQGQVVDGEERIRMQEALHRLNNLDAASDSSTDSDEAHEGMQGGEEVSNSAPVRKRQRQTVEALAERIEQVCLESLQRDHQSRGSSKLISLFAPCKPMFFLLLRET